jgi:hypothetical protein
MLDWPEQIQTSPTRTSLYVSVFFPAIVMVSGVVPAFSGSSVTSHLPSAPAVALPVSPPTVTVTFSPAPAVPHTGSFVPACSTM